MAWIKPAILLLSLIHGSQAASWAATPADGTIKYACAAETVTFPWNFNLTHGERLEDVQWFYQGDSGTEMVAVLTHGNFLPLPSFHGRVQFLPNAGMSLQSVVTADTGNYSVTISGQDEKGTFFKISRTVTLQIGADLMTTDNLLHVRENRVAVLDQGTHRWAIELHCGTFTYFAQPPFDVEWTTPSGQLMSSTSYKDGQYILLLDGPVQSGTYSCRIPTDALQSSCIPTGNGQTNGSASYTLDGTETRLQLLEAHQKAIQKDNDHLVSQNSVLQTTNANLVQRMAALEARIDQRVSFHARNLRNTSPKPDSPLIVDHVVLNQGNAYSPTTGKFTAPVNGTYFFMGTSGSWATGQKGQFELTMEGQQLSFVSTRDQGPLDAATVHGAVHLSKGQRVWLKVSSGVDFWSAATSFSGFLIDADP